MWPAPISLDCAIVLSCGSNFIGFVVSQMHWVARSGSPRINCFIGLCAWNVFSECLLHVFDREMMPSEVSGQPNAGSNSLGQEVERKAHLYI